MVCTNNSTFEVHAVYCCNSRGKPSHKDPRSFACSFPTLRSMGCTFHLGGNSLVVPEELTIILYFECWRVRWSVEEEMGVYMKKEAIIQWGQTLYERCSKTMTQFDASTDWIFRSKQELCRTLGMEAPILVNNILDTQTSPQRTGYHWTVTGSATLSISKLQDYWLLPTCVIQVSPEIVTWLTYETLFGVLANIESWELMRQQRAQLEIAPEHPR